MRKLLLSICASAALVLVAPCAVLAQGLVLDQYEPVPASVNQNRPAVAIQGPNELSQYVADTPGSPKQQYAIPDDCSNSACVEYDIDSAVEDAADDASGSAEDLPGALDTATLNAGGEARPASETAEDAANESPGPSKRTAGAGDAAGPSGDGDTTVPTAGTAEEGDADRPEEARPGSGGDESDAAIVLDELPATGGAPSAPIALGVVGFLLLIGGLPVRRRIVR